MKIARSPSRRRHSETGANDNDGIHQDLLRIQNENQESGSDRFLRRTKWLRRYLCSSSRQRWTICVVALFLLLFSPYLLYHSLNSEMGGQSERATSTNSFSSFIQPAPSESAKDQDGKSNLDEDGDSFLAAFEPERHVVEFHQRRNDELDRVRVSILNELRGLEEKRNHLRTEIDTLTVQSERLQTELRKGYKDLEQVKLLIDQANLIRREMTERNTPEIVLPKPLFPRPFVSSILPNKIKIADSNSCTMSTCFDYSRCSITSGFPIFIYGADQPSPSIFDQELVGLFSKSVYAVTDPSLACIFVVILKNGVVLTEESIKNLLPYWDRSGDGANHVVISSNNFTLGRSLIVGDQVGSRFGFDLVAPAFGMAIPEEDEKIFLESPALLPARRRYLLSVTHCPQLRNETEDGRFLINQFRRMGATKTEDLFYFHSSCQSIPSLENNDQILDIQPILDQSTFTLLIFGEDRRVEFMRRFIDSLKSGSVPVILTTSNMLHFLPFGETLDWRLATVQLPLSRLPELHFYIRTLTDSDIVNLRRHGSIFYRTYLWSKSRLAETILATLRQRLNIPAAPVEEKGLSSFFNETYQPTLGDLTTKLNEMPNVNEVDEYLGPVELPYPSPKYEQNFTMISTYSYQLWNVFADPFRLYPQFPFTKVAMPSEAKFVGSPYGFRPISNGAGGSGKDFSESLGGNYPREQFTVVLLTYEREQVLIAALSRLNNLPYLNKIIVVWNGPTPPNPGTIWPKLSAPIVVIKPDKNSLNNRFLPFREIETEAVLSMDDDVHLRKDEIIFGFRVWRETRERVVGFPARYHAWDADSKQWAYNSNHSCELSMVLTGAAFIHKYYFYVYTYSMPAPIRNKVDELMNCEDIAMNFLVSHMTKMAPLKVTSRWTFRCPGCPETLSADESHFLERHDCLNYFTRIYGYNPLMYTQFRVDSILFKMRIPHTHQKCFKFI